MQNKFIDLVLDEKKQRQDLPHVLPQLRGGRPHHATRAAILEEGQLVCRRRRWRSSGPSRGPATSCLLRRPVQDVRKLASMGGEE
ncbi:MAG: hypothetical protein MZU97_27245 [Bacillus subtilis]|nr:hypothetical protein [Bacillus subtilis]